MPRAPETPWNSPTIVPGRREPLPEADRPLRCDCDPWPCTEQTCERHLGGCPACVKHEQALFTRAEVRWVETNKGLPAAEVAALRNLWGDHDGHASRLMREGLPKYGTGGKPSEPVAEAC